MKKICLSHFSAFALLRHARVKNYEITYVKTDNLILNTPFNHQVKELYLFVNKILGSKQKIDILLSSRKNNSKLAKYHLWSYTGTAKVFVKVTANENSQYKSLFSKILLTSPELTFIQLSNKLPFYRYFQWGMEIIGNYALDRNSETGFVTSLAPLTSTKKITLYLNNNNQLCNSKTAKYVVKWLTDGSASPAETNLFILLCGPRKQGFWQIRKFKLNHQILLSPDAQTIYGYYQITPDFCCLPYKIVIEYDSYYFHANKSQNFKDKARIAALNHDGWTVITIIPNQVFNISALDNIAVDLLKMLGQNPRVKSKAFFEKHRHAYQNLTMLPRNN